MIIFNYLKFYYFLIFNWIFLIIINNLTWGLGIGDWGLGIGDWGLG